MTVLFEFIVIVVGFVVPVTSPDQLVNVYPVLGVAVKVTVVFWL